ncbi:GNAT family N-acetyltransferase [Streptomyces panaciradicis]|uniref:GNAT family N-acetyltransferase n=1 Tax=Streptomyces panaciradicis TaxID=1470261 RepID=UPI00201CB879|nr:GNAT family N-acetyltransferase [Streptomyces panaciradicis]MCL6669844.1 GNAT family N-acetyltransferase [Streptomyces panaciradicis]
MTETPSPLTGPFRTPRLDAVPLSVGHAEEMAVVLSDPALHTFIGGSPSSPEALRTRYERLVAGSPDPAVSWCNWVLRRREDSRLVGTVQATVTGPDAEIAWVVGTPWQGRGYASEAARGLVALLGRHTSVSTVTAHIHPGHAASAAVAHAAGLTPTDEEHEGERRWRLVLPR